MAASPSTLSPVFNHMALYVVNLKMSINFYHGILGLDTVPEPFKDGKHAWFSLGHPYTLHVIEGADEKKSYFRSNHFCLSVPSLEAFTKVLEKNKVAYVNTKGEINAVTIRPDGVKQIYFQDPDGYWIEMNDEKL